MFSVKLQVLGRRRVHTVSVVCASVVVVSPVVDAPTVVLVKVVLVKVELGSVDMETVELSVVDGSVVEWVSLPVVSAILGAESYVWHKYVSFQKCFVTFASLGMVFDFFRHNQPCYVLGCLWLHVRMRQRDLYKVTHISKGKKREKYSPLSKPQWSNQLCVMSH